MASALSNKIHANLGSVEALFATLDITSYAAGGESVSAATLGIAREPKKIIVLPSEKNLIYRWDKTNKKLLALYPHGATIVHNAAPAATTARISASDVLEGVLVGAANKKLADEGVELAATDDGGTVELVVLY